MYVEPPHSSITGTNQVDLLVSRTVGKKCQPHYIHPTSGRSTCSTVLTMRADHDRLVRNKNDLHMPKVVA